jgi:hypothetical protein
MEKEQPLTLFEVALSDAGMRKSFRNMELEPQ